ncbi:MAG TPA: HAD-IA family hydrolase [Baekduia sp.]|uniref:HAD family hydrolase n=1 Tax=Baekduia sp. TaxID=2600305 RepID=UPI002BF09CB7|nr:HAD-IA family hydrolase [Baekduia sp.]HMJ33832.1 HAD-IA family hydrolase [Baekduia sp.]
MTAPARRAVLLDALGVLLELEPPWPPLRAELAARGVAITEDEARTALRAEIAYYRAHHDEASDAERLEALRDRCARVLDAALPPHARGLPDLRAVLLASLRFRPYPEVAETLAALRDDGATRLVVVSNWDVSLHGVLADTGLAPLLDGAITSAECGSSKPDPAIFARALDLAGGVAPAAAVHAGDMVGADVEGARSAGIRPVLVARDGTAACPGVAVLEDLRGLPALVAAYLPLR